MQNLNSRGQLTIESIIATVIAFIMYTVLAAYVFLPVYNAMEGQLTNAGGTYATIVKSLLLIGIFIILPMLLIASAAMAMRPRMEGYQ